MASKEGHGTLKRLGFPVGSLKRSKNKVNRDFFFFLNQLILCIKNCQFYYEINLFKINHMLLKEIIFIL